MGAADSAEVATYLLSLTVPKAVTPLGLSIGLATLTMIERQFAVIDTVGTSYTGGPVLNLSDWEINVVGITDVQLAFSAAGRLDVVTLKVHKDHFAAVSSLFREVLNLEADDDLGQGCHCLTFCSATLQVMLETPSSDSPFTVTYLSAPFKNARDRALNHMA